MSWKRNSVDRDLVLCYTITITGRKKNQMEDKTFDTKKKSRLTDIIGVGILIAFIVAMATAVEVSIRSQKELRQNLEKSGHPVKSDDGREYEFGKVEAFGHEYITFHKGSSFGVTHSPDCPCKAVKGE